MKILSEFKEFAVKGNVLDMAVGVIIGGAFGVITTTLVDKVMMPPIGLLIGDVDFKNLFLVLGDGKFATLEEATKAGAPVVAYGVFINAVINFLLVAFAVFMMVRSLNKLKRTEAEAAPPAAPASPPASEVLLTEIRDLLRDRR
jgi:large conductance mechanosensitive channel